MASGEYVNGVINETGEHVAKNVLASSLDSMIPLAAQTAIVGDFAVPLKGATKYAKISPLVAIGLAADDTHRGYENTPNVIRDPNTLDKLAGGLAGLANSVSFGLVPEREGTQFLSKLFNGYKKDEASPVAEELQRKVNADYLERVRNNVMTNLTKQPSNFLEGLAAKDVAKQSQAAKDAEYMAQYYTSLGADLGYRKAMEDAKRVPYAVNEDLAADRALDEELYYIDQQNRINANKRATAPIPVVPKKGNPSTARDDAELAREKYNAERGLAVDSIY